MLNETQQKEFEEMVNESIEDLSEPQCDEYIPLNGEEPPSIRYAGRDETMVKPYEFVNKPKHYQLCGSETMPMIEQILGTEGYLAFLKGSALKYRFRAAKKPGNSVEQDIAKAMYMENLYNNFVRENTP